MYSLIVHLTLFYQISALNPWTITVDSSQGTFDAEIGGLKVLHTKVTTLRSFFVILYDEIIGHSKSSPFLFIGLGTTTYKEYHGNFDIKDYVQERIPLDRILEKQANRVTLAASSDDSIRVTLDFQSSDSGGASRISFTKIPDRFNRAWMRFVAESDEMVFGGGEQFTYLNLRGRNYPIWTREQGKYYMTREQGVGRNKSTLITFESDVMGGGAGGDYHTTYYAEPTYFSTRGYMVHSTATTYTILDFRNENFHELEIHDDIGDIEIAGDRMKTVAQLSQDYAKQILQPELPDWVFSGAIVGVQGGTKRMLEILEQVESNGVEVSALWIQDWAGKIRTTFGKRVFWNWEWNHEQYPGLDEEIQKLLKRGIRVLVYINPYLNAEGRLFKDADNLGHFVKNSSGKTNVADFGEFYCGTIDLTSSSAIQWYKDTIIKKIFELGIAGYMADFSEYLPVENVEFQSGQSAFELHNQWPRLWARVNREALDEYGQLGKAIFWMRAGFAGTSNYSTLMWAGDQNVDYTESDGLASTIPAALSMGLQGVGMTHFDIGGFTSLFGLRRTKELFLRSAEAAVFTPVMRTHEGNRPSENWQLYSDKDTMRKFARLVKIYKALAKYTREAIKSYTNTGIPVQRSLFYQYPQDKNSYQIEHQYMYGDDLMVAPVLQDGVSTWTCYLPPGNWKHLWSDVSYKGQKMVTVDAPLGKPPVFVKEGSSYDWSELKLPLIKEESQKSASISAGSYNKLSLVSYLISAVLSRLLAMSF